MAYYGRRVVRSLSETDWEKIWKLHWSTKQQKVLERLAGNEANVAGPYGVDYIGTNEVNVVFRKADCPYRIFRHGRGRMLQDVPYRIAVVKPDVRKAKLKEPPIRKKRAVAELIRVARIVVAHPSQENLKKLREILQIPSLE